MSAEVIPMLSRKVGWALDGVDPIELKQAFAAQILADSRALEQDGWDWEKVNVNGGAIALGHPPGATGA